MSIGPYNSWGNNNNVMGLNSGMDISSMISKIMQAESIPQQQLQQKLQLNEWQQDAYRSTNIALATFQSQIFNLQFSTGWQAQTATSSDTTKVTATANTGAPSASHSVVVTSLAAGASTSSSSSITTTLGLTGTALPASVTLDTTNNQFNLTINGQQKTITLATGSYSTNNSAGPSQLQQALQSAIDQAFGANTVTVGQSGTSLSLTPTGAPGALPQVQISNTGTVNGATVLGFTSGQAYKIDPNATLASQVTLGKFGGPTIAGAFQINGQTIQFDPNVDTLNILMNKVNSSAANVTMSYDSVSDKMIVATKNTGASAQISWSTTAGTQNDGGLLAALKINTTATVAGSNASASIDGVSLSESSNSFTYGGVTYNLVNTTGGTSVNVNVSTDTTALTKQITDFVNNYNTMINMIETKLNEPKYKGFPPLTSAQAAQLSDSQLNAYNAKAQSGLLSNDDILQQLYNNFRGTNISTIAGTSTYHALYQIGITTTQYSLSDPNNAGKLVINTSQLQTALSANPSDVATIMQNVTQQLTGFAQNAVNSIIARAGFSGGAYDSQSTTLGIQANTMESQINDWNTRLQAMYNNYVQQFTAMDTAVGQNNQQLSWLQSYFH